MEAVLDSMHSPRQLRVQDAGPIGTHSDIAKCAATTASAVGASDDEFVGAAKRLIDALPDRKQLALPDALPRQGEPSRWNAAKVWALHVRWRA